MKKFLLASVAAAAVGATAPALAADLGARPYPPRAPAYAPAPYAAPIYNWTGFYIGGHVGGAFAGSNNFNGVAISDSEARFLGGVQAGADWQFAPNWVLGAEGQYSWLSGNQAFATFPNGYVYTNHQGGIGSITGRIGWTWGPGLVYVKGGYAYSNNRETLILNGVPTLFLLDNEYANGYTVGAGLEYMFAPNWSAKAEYQYYNFGNTRFREPFDLAQFGSFHNDQHTFKGGINYRFNFGNFGGPVVARY